MKLKFTYLFFAVFFISQTGVGQSVRQHVLKMHEMWDSTVVNYTIQHGSPDTAIGLSLFNYKPIQTDTSAQTYTLEQNVSAKQIDVLKGDIGLDARIGYTENLDPGFGYDDNIFYYRKFSAGLSLDLLKSGYFSNHQKAKIKANELEILRIKNPEQAKQYDRYYKWHNIIYQFNLKKITILESREALNKERVAITQDLALLKEVTQKDLIEVITTQAEINSTLGIYQNYNDQLATEISGSNNQINHYPLFDINYAYTFKLLTSQEPDSVTNLMLQNIALENKGIHDFTLRPFVNYNFYDLVGNTPPSRSYFSVGVQFAAPLNFNARNKSELREAQAKLITAVPDETVQQHGDVLNQFYEFRYKLKQYVNMYNKRKMYEELLRKERVKYNISPSLFNPITALDLLDQLMKVDIELTDLHQQMYLKILDIHTEIPYCNINELVVPINMDGNKMQAHHNANALYLWSSSIKKYERSVISHYLELNNINTVYISINSNSEARSKTFALIKELGKNGISTHLMIGKNSLINGGMEEYLQKITQNIDFSYIQGIHLDVEPHTFSDYKENKSAYMLKYHSMINMAKKYCDLKGLSLSVSIPTHYPTADIEKIFSTVNNVVFMCYENVKTDFIVRKTSGYDAKKTIIALRTNDFKNRVELENKFKELSKQLNIGGYATHDFGSLYQFDLNSIHKK